MHQNHFYHLPPDFIPIFISKIEFILFFFLIFQYAPIPPSSQMSCYRYQFFAYIFFKCFALLKSIMQSHKSHMNNSFRIILIKIILVKINIIKIYTNNTHFITRKCAITRIFFKKEYIIIRE